MNNERRAAEDDALGDEAPWRKNEIDSAEKTKRIIIQADII